MSCIPKQTSLFLRYGLPPAPASDPDTGAVKAGIRALLDRDQVHIFKLSRVGVRTNFLEYARKDFVQRRPRRGQQFVPPQRPNENTLDFVAAEHDAIGKRRDIAFNEWKLESLYYRQQQTLHLFMG